ncbi:Sorting nexin-27 [Trichinella patagoniensis]|uniref:Sorting nexin-27 n=1 Tax=Trichinella patagoniensis TaxID=990121 RepID=A0A0V0ZBI0_9BILA|nr:Sorting nexin-27 [Trichinella sp. T9]KRY09683.1 Sorting nexin-27 [Trichinella patagoniensis]
MDADSSGDDCSSSTQDSQPRFCNSDLHNVYIQKAENGFGFNVRGQVSEGGQYRSINGQLFAPLQHVSAVIKNGAAEQAGLLRGDRILEVNGVNVEGATHKQVVDLIKSSGDELILTVISLSPSEQDRLDSSNHCDDNWNTSCYDYSEKRSLPVTIPSFQWVTSCGEKFVVYNVHMAGRHLCSRRYSEFEQLHRYLRNEFVEFCFPRLPIKWPFPLREHQLDTRRRGLEQYLERGGICSVRVIAESDIMQAFLMESNLHEASYSNVDIRILLPDQSWISVNVRKDSNCTNVYRALQKRLGWSDELANCFALFEMIESGFDRKINANERPHSLYIQNYSSAAVTCLIVKRWLFDVDKEEQLCSTDACLHDMFFWLAVNDVNSGQIQANEKLYELKALQDVQRKQQYLKLARALPGYAEITFPYCLSSWKNDGHVIVSLGFKRYLLQSCSSSGEPQEAVLELQWPNVEKYNVDEDGCFIIEYNAETANLKRVKVFTQFVSAIYVGLLRKDNGRTVGRKLNAYI